MEREEWSIVWAFCGQGRKWIQTYQLTGTQPLGPDGTVREDRNEEVGCAQEEIFSTGFDKNVALPLPQIF